MSEIREVDSKGNIIPETVTEASTMDTIGLYGGDLDTIAVSQVMGLENDSDRSKYKDDIKHLIEWAKLEGYDNPSELKWMIRDLINKLGTSAIGEPLITRASRYAFLKIQEGKIKREQESLLR